MIYEELMGWGDWEIALDTDTTPDSVWSALNVDDEGFGHVVVVPVPLDPDEFDTADLLDVALYTGIYYGPPAKDRISGLGLAAWLGDDDGKADVHEADVDGTDPTGTYTVRTFRAWVNDALKLTAGGLGPIVEGTYTNIAGTWSNVVVSPVPPLSVLDLVMDRFGGEWRINPDGTIDAGPEANLFVTSPTVIAAAGHGGRDAGLVALSEVRLDAGRDLHDYSTRVIVVGRDGTRGTANLSPATGYVDLHGNAVKRVRIVDAPNADTDLGSLASAHLGRFDEPRVSYTLTTLDADVRSRVAPGDTIWVYDPRPDLRLYDSANQVEVSGRVLFPVSKRVRAVSWPLHEGMGVLFRKGDGSWIDLTPFVVWEGSREAPGETTLHVGAQPRKAVAVSGPLQTVEVMLSGPRGELGYAERTAGQTGITSEVDLTGLSVTVTVGTARRIRVSFTALVNTDTAGTGVARVRINEDGANIQLCQIGTVAANSSQTLSGWIEVTPTAGSHTYKLRGQGVGATMAVSSSATASITVEDLGPA